MLRQQNAESFAGIVVGVLILSFVILGIVRLLIFSNGLTYKYEEQNHIQVLSQNLSNIVRELDTSSLRQNEIFFVHRNRANSHRYEIYSGSVNDSYRYVNKSGDTIDPNTYEGDDIYSQVLWLAQEDTSVVSQNQIIRASIKKLVRKQ